MDTSNQTQPTTRETIKVTSSRMVEEVKRIMHEGNVRRIVVKQDDHTIAEFPLAVGVVGTLLAAPLAALAALAALLNEYTIEVERAKPAPGDQTSDQPADIPANAEQSVGEPADPKITTPA